MKMKRPNRPTLSLQEELEFNSNNFSQSFIISFHWYNGNLNYNKK